MERATSGKGTAEIEDSIPLVTQKKKITGGFGRCVSALGNRCTGKGKRANIHKKTTYEGGKMVRPRG